MIGPSDEPRRLAGTLITLDGPGGVGKSAAARLVVDTLAAAGLPVHATTQPSRAPIGELARHGTDTYRGMALACLCAADRHHQLEVEIKPALREGKVVICDRYVASSLVLQGLDGLSGDTVWQLNHGVYRPDLAVILNGDPTSSTADCGGEAGTAASSAPRTTATWSPGSTFTPWSTCKPRDGP